MSRLRDDARLGSGAAGQFCGSVPVSSALDPSDPGRSAYHFPKEDTEEGVQDIDCGYRGMLLHRFRNPDGGLRQHDRRVPSVGRSDRQGHPVDQKQVLGE